MSACHLRRDRARQKGFRNDPSLDLVAPATTTSRPDPAPRLRNVNYVVDHRCEPICVGWFVFTAQLAGDNVGTEDRLRSTVMPCDRNRVETRPLTNAAFTVCELVRPKSDGFCAPPGCNFGWLTREGPP
jgi:hypothetical protein